MRRRRQLQRMFTVKQASSPKGPNRSMIAGEAATYGAGPGLTGETRRPRTYREQRGRPHDVVLATHICLPDPSRPLGDEAPKRMLP